ncbi:hypothetical protein BKA93DRAFT_884529 [Sparassis latifolia]
MLPPAEPSPDVEMFSTPPITPTVAELEIRPSISRRSSRPSNLQLQPCSPNPIVLDQQHSPYRHRSKPHTVPSETTSDSTNGMPPPMAHDPTVTAQSQSGPLHHAHSHSHSHSQSISPYFVHSQLQGASFKDWLSAKQSKAIQDARMVHAHQHAYSDGTISEPYSDDDAEYGGSLTAQLAETAVGVREMSKQLGRTHVHSHIQTILIVTKARDNRLIQLTRELALYLMLKPRNGGRGMVVYVDAQLRTSRRFDAVRIEREHPELFVPFPRRRSSSSSSLASTVSKEEMNGVAEGQLRYWTADMCSRTPHLFDFVVTLGGDGTVLFTSWLFQRIVPPVLPFALGSLGFLTNFDFADHPSVMDSAIDNGIRVNLRMRFTCTVYRAVAPEPGKWSRCAVKKGNTGEIIMKNLEQGGWEALEGGCPPHDGKYGCSKDKEIMCFSTRPVESFEVLNDLVVDRGPSPYVSLLELFGDEHHLTTVQADGLTISTPTGSTAYSLSAGGSLVHPEIPAILITPICPHTLSFRPLLLPDSMELRICVPFNSRSTAWASFDGRGRVELKQGDHIKVTASKYPFPTVCADTQSVDWFNSISSTLKWNERERQKSFVVVEEGPSRKQYKHSKLTSPKGEVPLASQAQDEPASAAQRPETGFVPVGDAEGRVEEDEEDEVSSDEEKYDIDDLSSNESPSSSTKDVEVTTESAKLSPTQAETGKEKVFEEEATRRDQAKAEHAARLLSIGSPYMQKYTRRSRSRTRSGVQTPDRFAGPHPHPPKLSPRHVQFASPSISSSTSSLVSHIQSRSRTPRTRETDRETVNTPTPAAAPWGRRSGSRSRSGERANGDGGPHRRAFCVWGQDESDSATSDSDVET